GGLKLDLLDERLALTLEAYRTAQTNVLSSPLFGSPGNRGDFFITPGRVANGLEIDLAGRPWPALDVKLGLGFMRANDRLSAMPGLAAAEVYVPAGAIPARSMHLLSRYTLPESWMPNTRLGMAARARSSSFAIPPNPALPGAQLVLPGGAVLDLSLERLFGRWALNAIVHNVFDRQLYETQSSPGYIPLEPRRSFGLTVTYKPPGLQP
ncbi:MAG TPA: hypothetical protein VFL86_29330, partial [Burkholderiaceae bacterium]|nr:hypothetical protein [Burkholderiaceae bacterium]